MIYSSRDSEFSDFDKILIKGESKNVVYKFWYIPFKYFVLNSEQVSYLFW